MTHLIVTCSIIIRSGFVEANVFPSDLSSHQWSTMRNSGISRRDYERLSPETKEKAVMLFESLKTELRAQGFSLRFLDLDGRWKELAAPTFLSKSQDDYSRLIRGSKWVRSRNKQDLLEKIAELYSIVTLTPKEKETHLERWLGGP